MTQLYILHASDPRRATVLANAHAFLDRLPADRSWGIAVTPYRKPRSVDQNAATFGVAYATIMAATGLEGEEERKQLHRDFCKLYFGEVDAGCGRTRPKRTTTRNERGERDVIDTATMADFYNFIQRRAASYGLDIPDPDPFWQQNQG